MRCLIWSNEHDMWWAPNRMGYVKHKAEAGVYSLDEATRIVIEANFHQTETSIPNEAIVPLELPSDAGC